MLLDRVEGPRLRAAVVGHVEWVQFMRVEQTPGPGDIVHASEWWEEPAGGGPGAAVQLHKLGAETTLFTALGNDEIGRAACADLARRGLRMEVAWRDAATRRAVTHVDRQGERTITVMGERLAPSGNDALDWDSLSGMDAVYFTAGDSEALRNARRARVLTATSRAMPSLRATEDVQLDALVGSLVDPSEAFKREDLHLTPRLAVWTDGARGGCAVDESGDVVGYVPESLPGPIVDRYGAGDSFVAGLTFGLGRGLDAHDALRIAARCGASAVTGRGAYEGQLDESGITEEGWQLRRQ